MSYRFVDSFRAGPGWNCRSIHKFVKLVHLVGFIIKKFFKMHGHINVKKRCILKFMLIDRSQENVIVLTILITVWSQFVSFEVFFII